MIAIRGNSAIAAALIPHLPVSETVLELPRGRLVCHQAQRYLFLQGLLTPTPIRQQIPAERERAFSVNCAEIVAACDEVIEKNPIARICVLGSESGFAWSYDGAYAAAKAALHRYVETRRLMPEQQLVAVAPTIIGDAGMTIRRTDADVLKRRERSHPKHRFLTSAEVAAMIHFLLYVDRGYTTNVVIRMNGGEHLWPR